MLFYAIGHLFITTVFGLVLALMHAHNAGLGNEVGLIIAYSLISMLLVFSCDCDRSDSKLKAKMWKESSDASKKNADAAQQRWHLQGYRVCRLEELYNRARQSHGGLLVDNMACTVNNCDSADYPPWLKDAVDKFWLGWHAESKLLLEATKQ
jgi:hypothetical protein